MTPDEHEAVQRLADQEAGGNLSEMVRALIGEAMVSRSSASRVFNVDGVVMAAAIDLGVHATETEEFTGPLPGVRQTVFHFVDGESAQRFSRRCMRDGLPARAYGPVAVVLHE